MFTVQGSATEMTRDEKLARYRHLRTINMGQQSGALRRVAADTLLELGRRLDIVHGRTLVCENPSELDLLYDLAVYAGKAGRPRAIDRYARQIGPTLSGDAAMMLRSAQAARFHLWRVERPHEIIGLWLLNIVDDNEMWLIDEGLEASCPTGVVFAGRLMTVEDFVMTCGVSVPLNVTLLAAALDSVPKVVRGNPEDLADNPRLAICIYRSAIETGTMDGMEFVDPLERTPETALAD
jgi:hypothetical protein